MSVPTPVILLTGESRELVEGSLREDLQAGDIRMAESLWQPFQMAVLQRALLRGLLDADLPQHRHWEWVRKIHEASPETHFFGVEYQGEMQGLVSVKTGLALLDEQVGQPLVYVDYLAVAPWNDSAFLGRIGESPRFRRVGRALVGSAVRYSRRLGWEGRVGLHALPQAERFYSAACGMTPMGRDLTYYGLRYFEMTVAQAAGFEQEG